ncbi:MULTISPECIES: hypothetical protein [Cetobacterium]|uniref:BZIP domain-containing protein n=1 Tax=Candidatus Cetobacterium colombiensis TaxID=3073100 RepID=A0ABU4WCR6_9FUSO|nr:hypothetical protein [Candidatus Cetobacterium colombiensis]MDX8337319.1 hypothetical protein [Candidatus Cetobacterium colombiensis]
MKIISKNKPKGTEYNELKNLKKAKRIVKTKEDRRRAENKRVNAEARKERRLENEFYDRVKEVEILGFNKGMLIVRIGEDTEKRSLTYGRRSIDLKENLSLIGNFQLKLFGEMVELKNLKNFTQMKDQIAWAISEDL